MRSSYKKIGPYVRQANIRNAGLAVTNLQGININKQFMPSVANTVDVDLSKYKIVQKGQFAFNPMHVGRDEMLPISMLEADDPVIVSPAYVVFEVKDQEELDPKYLMMWCRRPEFDRNAWFTTDSSVRGGFSWEDFCDMDIPIPSIKKQREIVREYNTIVNRIKLNEQLNRKLEETAQAIYKHWFVDFEFPISAEYASSIGKPELEGKPYKTSGGEMVTGDEVFSEIPQGWNIPQLVSVTSKIGSGATPKGGKGAYHRTGIALIRSTNIFDYNFSYSDLAFINNEQASRLSNVEVSNNDVLINITGVSVARCYKVPSNVLPARVNQHVAIVRPKDGQRLTNYLVCALCSTDYKSRLLGVSDGGSTRQALTKSDLENCKILLPDRDTLFNFEKTVAPIFVKKEHLSEEILLLSEAKDLLLSSIAAARNLDRSAA